MISATLSFCPAPYLFDKTFLHLRGASRAFRLQDQAYAASGPANGPFSLHRLIGNVKAAVLPVPSVRYRGTSACEHVGDRLLWIGWGWKPAAGTAARTLSEKQSLEKRQGPSSRGRRY